MKFGNFLVTPALLAALLMSVASSARADEGDIAYFRQFLFKKVVDTSDPDFPKVHYRYLMAGVRSVFSNEKGEKVLIMSSLRLYEDGTYEGYHREMVESGPPFPDGTQPMFPAGCKKLKGHWSVPDKQIEIEGLGRGDRHFQDNQHMIKLTYGVDLISKGLNGFSGVLAYGFSTSPPENEFCF